MKLPRMVGEDLPYMIRLILTAFDNNLTVANNMKSGDVESVIADALDHTLTIDANFVGSKIKYSTLPDNYANDAAASAGGVTIGEVYRNGSILQIRVS